MSVRRACDAASGSSPPAVSPSFADSSSRNLRSAQGLKIESIGYRYRCLGAQPWDWIAPGWHQNDSRLVILRGPGHVEL